MVTSARYIMAWLWLEHFGYKYDRVMLSDTKDVIFQAHPMDWNMEQKVYFFEEGYYSTIGDCQFNSQYIIPFGDAVREKLQDRWISCSGTVMGMKDPVMTYLQEMQNAFKLVHDNPYYQQVASLDQGTHNYVLYLVMLKDHSGITAIMANSIVVKTMAYELHADKYVKYGTDAPVRSMFPFDTDDNICNETGDVIPVIHQFDRNIELHHSIILGKYRADTPAWNPPPPKKVKSKKKKSKTRHK